MGKSAYHCIDLVSKGSRSTSKSQIRCAIYILKADTGISQYYTFLSTYGTESIEIEHLCGGNRADKKPTISCKGSNARRHKSKGYENKNDRQSWSIILMLVIGS